MKLSTLLLSSVCVLAFAACSHGGKKHHHKHGKDHHAKMWQKMDADNNGEVTKEEFNKAHEEMFKMMDANSDGKVTKEEKMAHKKKMMEGKECCK